MDTRNVPLPADARVAVLGLGSMGGAMASTLHRVGWRVSGYDPAPAAREAAATAGISCTESVDALAGIPHIVLSLPSAAVVAETVPTLLAEPGIRAIVDTSTSEPQVSAEMCRLARAQAASFVDAPVSGGRTGADSGTLSAYVGANDTDFAACLPLLQTLTGGNIHRVGPSGSGNVVKLLNNVLCATNLAAVAEALDIAAAYGVDTRQAAAAISVGSGGSFASSTMYPKWILSGAFESGFSLGLMARDVDLALTVGAARGAAPTVLKATRTAWQKALALLGPAADFTRAPVTATTATSALADETTESGDTA